MKNVLLLIPFLSLLIASPALAQNTDDPKSANDPANPPPAAPAAEAASAPAAASQPAQKKPRRPAKGRNAREKEIEGSEARNRFQADTVLKSKYQHNGEQLEVDPD